MQAHLGKIVRKLLKEKGISIVGFCKMIGRSDSVIYKIVKQKYLHTKLLEEISIALNHDMFQYLYDDGKLPSDKTLDVKLAQQQTEIAQLKLENQTLKDVIAILKKNK